MNIQQALKQAKDLQDKVTQLQKQLENELVEGQAGGGMVKVTSSCKGKIEKINIDASLLVASEKEVLEDLLIAAINNAKQNADVKTAEGMKSISGSMGLPADFNLNNMFGG